MSAPHDFERACTLILELEGGAKVHAHPDDPGGLTKYGISQRAYPSLDIAALTEAQARAIYLSDYWMASGCDSMPWPLALYVFDCAVNQGVGRAVRWLQRVLAVKEDGKLGPATRLAARQAVAADASEFMAVREQHYRRLPTFGTFGRGWLNRLERVKREGAT